MAEARKTWKLKSFGCVENATVQGLEWRHEVQNVARSQEPTTQKQNRNGLARPPKQGQNGAEWDLTKEVQCLFWLKSAAQKCTNPIETWSVRPSKQAAERKT